MKLVHFKQCVSFYVICVNVLRWILYDDGTETLCYLARYKLMDTEMELEKANEIF